jgi:hypothetical protein
MAAELGEFIQKEHAIVGQRDFAREKYHQPGLSSR